MCGWRIAGDKQWVGRRTAGAVLANYELQAQNEETEGEAAGCCAAWRSCSRSLKGGGKAAKEGCAAAACCVASGRVPEKGAVTLVGRKQHRLAKVQQEPAGRRKSRKAQEDRATRAGEGRAPILHHNLHPNFAE
ncbi:hypothetical protein L7F22_024500 [Adiantum nelumboides]|nr:hypothetical protein [Adiantum nelumboides]